MNYIILDLEWNQPVDKRITKPIVLVGEIIQIGAAKLDERFNIVDTFNRIISPKFYTKMKRQVSLLTKLSEDDLKNGVVFEKAFREFSEWCGDDFCLLTWGPDDHEIFRTNLLINGFSPESISTCYNAQLIFSNQIAKESRQFSLSDAAKMLGEAPHDAHNALSDAITAAKICRHLNLSSAIEHYNELTCDGQPTNAALISSLTPKRTFDSISKIKADKHLKTVICPECGSKIVCGDFIKHNGAKIISLCKCSCGTEIFIRIKYKRNQYGKLSVARNAYIANDASRKLFENAKLKLEKSHIAYLKKKKQTVSV